MLPPAAELQEVAHHLLNARNILFITGAGISAESGLPTYRGIGGLYEDRHTDDDIPIERALSGPMLRQRPELVWKYLLQLESACRGRHCNAAHRFIARVEAWCPSTWTLTQNIDSFHREAGSQNLIEIHGHLRRLDCMNCGQTRSVTSFAGLQIPPRCTCGGLLRPPVVLFEEMLPQDQLALYEEALAAKPELIFSIGTTSVFPYIAAPVIQAQRWGGRVVEINPAATEVSRFAEHRWRCSAVEACDALLGAIQSQLTPEQRGPFSS